MRIALTIALACSARVATADSALPRVITAPTANLLAPGETFATVGSDHRGALTVAGGIGLGGIAMLDVGLDTDVRGAGDPLWLGRAGFRMGVAQDAWFAGAPALLLGVRTTFAAHGHTFGAARVSQAQLIATRSLGSLRVHAGAEVIDAAFAARRVHMGNTVRPLAGLEWTPAIYPRTTLLADVAWVPHLDMESVETEWLAGWGVRYQATGWGSVELAVRHREDEGLAQSTVLVRFNLLAQRAGEKSRSAR